MRFCNDHDPLPLLQQLQGHFGDAIRIEYLSRNPGEIVIDFHIVRVNRAPRRPEHHARRCAKVGRQRGHSTLSTHRALSDVHALGQKIQKSPHAQRQVAALADIDSVDFLDIAWIAVFQHRQQAASSNVITHLERCQTCPPKSCQGQPAQCLAVAGLGVL